MATESLFVCDLAVAAASLPCGWLPGARSAQLDADILVVIEDLEQDGHVDDDLQAAAHPELRRTVIQHEVHGLEDVTSRPQ